MANYGELGNFQLCCHLVLQYRPVTIENSPIHHHLPNVKCPAKLKISKTSFTMNYFWRQFEQFNNCKYPKVIKDILKFCAIDKRTFEDIDEKTVTEIEQVVNKNKIILKESEYHSVFEKDEEFKFLFGHRLFLQNLSKKYRKFRKFQEEKKKLRKETFKELKSAASHDIRTTGETCHLDQIKKLLLEKLNNRSNKKYSISQNEVKKLNVKGDQAYCVVQCPFCEKKVPCTFVSNWNITNFCNHVRLHLENEEEPKEANQASNPAPETVNTASDTANSFRTARNSVLEELSTILR